MPIPNPLASTGNNEYDPIPIYHTNRSVDNLTIEPQGVVTLRRRSELWQALDGLPRALDQSGMMSAMDVFHRRALEMLSSRGTRGAFDLAPADDGTRSRYGGAHWGKTVRTCRRLVDTG